MLGMVLINISIFYKRTIPSQTSLSLLSQLGGFLQVYFLLMGTWELITQRKLPRTVRTYAIAGVCAAAAMSVFIAMDGKEFAFTRYALRYGLRTLLLGSAYAIAAYMVWTHPRFVKGFGQKLLGISFLLFSAVQLTYLSIIVLNLLGAEYSVPNFFGIVDLFVISLTGLSMVMWLLEEERDKLNKSNHELNGFLYRTSHDLRAPIATILGLANLARLEVKDNTSLNYFEKIEHRTKKLDSVIQDIMLFSQNTKRDLQIQWIDFNELVQAAIAEISFSKNNKPIKFHYEPNSNNMLKTDYNMLKTIVYNLIENAVHYHKHQVDNPFVRVTFRKNSYKVLIEVEDNGPGIEDIHLPKVFDMFYRASVESDGTGLGLYIVREAVLRLKGNIGVQSPPGKGARFSITLPATFS